MSLRRRRPLLIGLTGPIGCGKTTIAGWLAARGAVVVDADRLARGVLEPGGPALEQVIAAFGPDVLGPDGRLDRAALAARVFADPAERRRLEAITSPAVRPRIDAELDAGARSGAPAIVLEAIRLVEAGYAQRCDEVWLVVCGAREQRERLGARGMTPDDLEARIAAQADLAERVRPVATRIIDTSGPIEAVRLDVGSAFDEALAHRRRRRPAKSPGS